MKSDARPVSSGHAGRIADRRRCNCGRGRCRCRRGDDPRDGKPRCRGRCRGRRRGGCRGGCRGRCGRWWWCRGRRDDRHGRRYGKSGHGGFGDMHAGNVSPGACCSLSGRGVPRAQCHKTYRQSCNNGECRCECNADPHGTSLRRARQGARLCSVWAGSGQLHSRPERRAGRRRPFWLSAAGCAAGCVKARGVVLGVSSLRRIPGQPRWTGVP
jgi:hypothetical protein